MRQISRAGVAEGRDQTNLFAQAGNTNLVPGKRHAIGCKCKGLTSVLLEYA